MTSDNSDKREEERKTAETYRQDRLASENRKTGAGDKLGRDNYLAWLRQNRDAIISSEVESGAPLRVAEEAYLRLTKDIEELPECSPFEEAGQKPIFQRVIFVIEDACKLLGIETRHGVVFGAVQEKGFNAAQSPVLMTDVSILRISMLLFPFLWNVSRLFASSLPTISLGEDRVAAAFFPPAVRKIMTEKNLYERWFYLIGSAAEEGHPFQSVPAGSPPLRVEIFGAMLLFVVAHEFSHHALRHDVAEGNPLRLELEADSLARKISIVAMNSHGERSPYAMSGVGAAMALGALELVARAERVLSGTYDEGERPSKSHPSYSARMENLALTDAEISGISVAERDHLVLSRKHVISIIETIWAELLPAFRGRRMQGVRAARDIEMQDGWLPFHSGR